MNWGENQYYDRDGKRIPIWLFGWLSEQKTYKCVARSAVLNAEGEAFQIVTMWLGWDPMLHDAARLRLPNIFGTALFDPSGQMATEDMTPDESRARATHDDVVRDVAGEFKRCTIVHTPTVNGEPQPIVLHLPCRRSLLGRR